MNASTTWGDKRIRKVVVQWGNEVLEIWDVRSEPVRWRAGF
jgi:hypothetical protein